jgi:hypothetical protein
MGKMLMPLKCFAASLFPRYTILNDGIWAFGLRCQQLDNVRVPPADGLIQRRTSPAVARGEIGIAGQQQFDDLPVTAQSRFVQGGVAFLVRDTNRGTMHKKQLHHAAGGVMQGCCSVAIDCVDLRAVSEKKFGEYLVANVGRAMQRCCPILISCVDISATGEKAINQSSVRVPQACVKYLGILTTVVNSAHCNSPSVSAKRRARRKQQGRLAGLVSRIDIGPAIDQQFCHIEVARPQGQ